MQNAHNFTTACLLLFVLVSSPAFAQTESPVVLQGFAEHHADRLAPVAPQLQAGAIFNEQELAQLEPNNEWYWIPSWYAGQKHVDTQLVLQDYNFQTGQRVEVNRQITNKQDLNIGFQPDRNGQVWEFKRAPYTATVERDKFFTTMLVRNRDPLKVTQDVVVLRLLQTSIDVDKRSRRILKTLQEEQINTYTPGPQGTMNMQTSLKTFGPDGMPQIQEQSTRVVYTTAPFQPVNIYQGRDMRALFRNYLLTHGFSQYLPDDLRQESQGSSQDHAVPASSSMGQPSIEVPASNPMAQANTQTP